MTGWLIAASGLLVLIGIAIAIGASLDTEGQRRERRRLAEERRRRAEEAADADDLDRTGLCERCPLRLIR